MDPTGNDARTDTKHKTLVGCLLLLVFLLYANSLANGFVYDDHAQIERNPYIHSVKNIGTLVSTSMLAYFGKGKQEIRNYYRPVMAVGYLLCFKLFGPFPMGFHLVTVLMHCLVVWLVYAVTTELMADKAFGLIAAACFALHPIHTEPVDWLGGIADVEMSIFYLLAFWLFLRLERKEGTRKIWAQAAMLGSFFLATFSKETAMTLPALATFYEHFCRGDRRETNWKTKLSRYGGFWIFGLIYVGARAAALGGLVPRALHADVGHYGTALTGLALIGKYAARLVWPAPLAAFYPFEKSVTFLDRWVLLGAAVIVAAATFAAWEWKRNRVYIFATLWMFLTLAPVLNVHWMAAIVFAERYLYLPSVGFCWLVAGCVLWCWRKSGEGMQTRRWIVGVAACIVALLFAGETVARNRDWRDDRSVALRTLQFYPEASYLRADVGMSEWQSGNHDEALRQWRAALEYQPDAPEALADIGFAMLEEKNYDAAIPPLQRAIAVSPQFAMPHVYLARVYAARGQETQAETEFERAVEILPMNSFVRNAFGRFYLDSGRAQEAQREFLASVTADGDEEGWSGLAEAYTLLDRPDDAEEAWRHVLALDVFSAHAHLGLARIYLGKGRSAEAEAQFESCLSMDPRNTEALTAVQNLRLQANLPANSR